MQSLTGFRGVTARRSGVALAAALLAGWGAQVPLLAAQRVSSSITLSGVSLRYVDTVNAGAATLSPSVGFSWPRATAGFTGAFSQFGSGGWAAQGALSGSGIFPVNPWLAGEIAGSAAGTAHSDDTRTGQALGIARVHLMQRDAGFWLGGGLGQTWDREFRNGLRQVEAGAWARIDRGTVVATISPTAVGDSIRYTDSQVLGSWELNRVELTASAGWRIGTRLPVYGSDKRFWANTQVVWWAGSQISLVVGAGTYPVDLTQGFPGGRYGTVGIRLSTRRQPRQSGWAGQHDNGLAGATASGITAFLVDTSGGQRLVRVRAPAASSVEISGDFTRWESVSLIASADGWWSVALPIVPGTYQVSIRLNQGEWQVPPGLVAITDEFGGMSGVLVIEDRTL